jgi:hypothetical protein
MYTDKTTVVCDVNVFLLSVVLHRRLSFCDILAVVLVALIAVTHCNPREDTPKWFNPCGTRRSHSAEQKLVNQCQFKAIF